MKPLLLAIVGSFAIGLSLPCQADGFFRRLPEVGEWAKYEVVMLVVVDVKEGNVNAPEMPEITGELTLKCVGEESIEEVRHLWLEARIDVSDSDAGEHWLVVKLLVPADQVIDGDLSEHIVRAWTSRDDLAEPQEFELDVNTFNENPSWFAMLVAFPVSDVRTSRRQNKTLTIDGEEVQLTHNESGPLPERELDDATVTGEATWWPSADHAFGVAAPEQMWSITMLEPIEIDMEYAMQMDLIETGTDAVSDLPEHD